MKVNPGGGQGKLSRARGTPRRDPGTIWEDRKSGRTLEYRRKKGARDTGGIALKRGLLYVKVTELSGPEELRGSLGKRRGA